MVWRCVLILAWIGAAAVGLSLGLLGSGGSILTVPILVFLVGHEEKAAIVESLGIVGAIAAFGCLRASAQGKVDWQSVLLLAFPGVIGAYVGALLAQFVSGALQLLMLATMMLTAAGMMYRGEKRTIHATNAGDGPKHGSPPGAYGWAALQGFGLGMATGLVGVGGGFLIVPVLVLVRRLPMATAVGTSLGVIAINSAAGYVKSLSLHHAGGMNIDLATVGLFIALGVAGSLVGAAVSNRIPQQTLKRIFAVFLVMMALYITYRQAPGVFSGISQSFPTGESP